MAAGTFAGKLLLFDARCMAGVAVDMRVRTFQREFETCVIKCARMPGLVAVASGAVAAEAAAMTIIAAVAARAILGQSVLEIAAAMAIGAAHMSVRAFQRESSLPTMVELRRLPACHRVAVGAVVAAAAAVHIVRRMASGAFLRRTAVVLTHVAGGASNCTMLVAQREACLLVVK
jgi:hypothetical protein